MKLVLATRNLGKVHELTTLLNSNNTHRYIQILSLQDFPDAPEVIEDGRTYAENATKKATVIATWTGLRTLADDAGLEVDALDGAPGVHSKRWAGTDATDTIRIQKLLKAIDGAATRKARFVAAIALAEPKDNNKIDVVIGTCEGHITYTPAGESGFGYDPIFIPDGYQKTFAELGNTVKNRISHRGKALQLALELL